MVSKNLREPVSKSSYGNTLFANTWSLSVMVMAYWCCFCFVCFLFLQSFWFYCSSFQRLYFCSKDDLL